MRLSQQILFNMASWNAYRENELDSEIFTCNSEAMSDGIILWDARNVFHYDILTHNSEAMLEAMTSKSNTLTFQEETLSV